MGQLSPYAEVAAERRKDLPSRLFFAVFITAAACAFCRIGGPLLWLAAVIVVQSADAVLANGLIRRGENPPLWLRRAYVASAFICASVFSSIALYLWFEGELAGKVFGVLTPAGALLNVALTRNRTRKLVLASWLPHLVLLIGMPMVYGLAAPGEPALAWFFVSLGATAYVGHVILAMLRIDRSRRQMSKALELADQERARAERASAAKSDFLATMSHEIRTPMNAVVAAANLLRRTGLSSEQADHVAMLINGSEMLTGLLSDVLDLAKIESGKLVIDSARTPLVDKLDAAATLWRAHAEQKGLHLLFDPGDLPAMVMSDPLRVQQIVFNLLSNAVKFTASGSIVLRGGRCGGEDAARFWIEVADTGRGISEDAVHRVFDSFEQGSTGVTREFGGTGLGLSISLCLAQLMGGSLSVSSRVGQGSTFRFEAPLIEAAPDVAAALQAAPDRACAHATILLAEDHPINQRIVRLILEPLGYRLTVAANGVEAVEAATAQAFDVILMDMQMPVMGGVEATTQIRALAGPNQATPVLAFTANAMEEHKAEWAAVGVDVFLTKPVDLVALLAAVRGAVEAAPADRRAA